mmetsp:Transcript_20534/g.52744  ORF Transcript_20534/g.52744 Transcript_20534/m.52744 type:complete len:167 (-) Transcript_20534:991-1491(-)
MACIPSAPPSSHLDHDDGHEEIRREMEKTSLLLKSTRYTADEAEVSLRALATCPPFSHPVNCVLLSVTYPSRSIVRILTLYLVHCLSSPTFFVNLPSLSILAAYLFASVFFTAVKVLCKVNRSGWENGEVPLSGWARDRRSSLSPHTQRRTKAERAERKQRWGKRR